MASGSSPLARGLPVEHIEMISKDRIIPARAGFTASTGTCGSTSPDHPRSRGVYSIEGGVIRGSVGSSPLARGLRVRRRATRIRGRIIPARAGFTERIRHLSNEYKDHPRSRGVYVCGRS